MQYAARRRRDERVRVDERPPAILRSAAQLGNGGFMRFSWTIYPGPKAQVGWYMYATDNERDTALGGNPSTPLKQFEETLRGHEQHSDFLAEVRNLGLERQL